MRKYLPIIIPVIITLPIFTLWISHELIHNRPIPPVYQGTPEPKTEAQRRDEILQRAYEACRETKASEAAVIRCVHSRVL